MSFYEISELAKRKACPAFWNILFLNCFIIKCPKSIILLLMTIYSPKFYLTSTGAY